MHPDQEHEEEGAAPVPNVVPLRRFGVMEGAALRQPPTNLQAEMALLGGLLASNAAVAQVAEFLRPEHFAAPENAAVYAAILRRTSVGAIADPITLRAEMAGEPALDVVGGVAYLPQLLMAMVGTKYLTPYGRSVHDAWMRREMIAQGEALVQRAYGDADLPAIMAEHSRALGDLTGAMIEGAPRGAVMLGDAMQQALDLADAVARGERTVGISTGMHAVDDVIGGLEPGAVYVMAGRPGSGKSSLGHQWAIRAALAQVGVLEISLEMSARALGARALAAAARVPLAALRSGAHGPHAAALNAAQAELRDVPLSIEDGGGMTHGDILAKARAARRRHGLGLILVDHLQIVKADAADVRNGSTAMVTAISHAMKAVAKEMDVPVLLLSQLNRGVEGREDKRPTMGDLRQSGAIEEDADCVAFVHRPELFLSKAQPAQNEGEHDEKYATRLSDYLRQRARLRGKAELIFEKVREGEASTVPLAFDGATASFSEITQSDPADYYGAP